MNAFFLVFLEFFAFYFGIHIYLYTFIFVIRDEWNNYGNGTATQPPAVYERKVVSEDSFVIFIFVVYVLI